MAGVSSYFTLGIVSVMLYSFMVLAAIYRSSTFDICAAPAFRVWQIGE